ncbi:MAG: hypothetical protein BWK78_03280 [Thiotrichaceae bacterium IS1]|nr:MAG: hypothetical protein BWK78_03280 [Thiotrichaceae bacterium IS1]
MKLLSIPTIWCLVSCVAVNADQSLTYPLSCKLDLVEIRGAFKVNLSTDINVSECNLVIQAKDEEIRNVVITQNDSLVVRTTERAVFHKTPELSIRLPQLAQFIASGVVDSYLEKIQANYFQINLSGKSSLHINGQTEKLLAKVTGVSKIDARDFLSQDADITVTGNSMVTIHVSKTLSAEATGVSKILYEGTPSILKHKITGISQISKLNE